MDNLAAMFSLEAEQSVLGALLLDGSVWDEISHAVTVADFVRTEHRLIFGAIARLAEAGKAVDSLTVTEKLDEFAELDDAGGMVYLGQLVANTAGTANVKAYAEIVGQRANLRRLMQAFKAGEADIEDPDIGLPEKVERVTERLHSALASLSTAGEAKSAKEAGRSWLENMNETFERGSTITGIRTGFPHLDKTIRGLNKKRLVLIAARPSMGKSTVAVNIARNVLNDGGSVFLATMEMSSDDVMNQLCACHTGCSYEKVQEAALGDDEVRMATGVFASALSQWKLTIDDRGSQTVASVRRGVKRHARKHGAPVVIVDYAQLMSDRAESEVIRIGEISRGLKMLAQDLDITVILLSQLSRDCEKRPDKRPMLSDLRGSGSLEQDASEVLFLYDDSVYNPSTMAAGYTELIVAKNRHGKRGQVLPLLKQLDRARFLTPDFRELPEDWRGQNSNNNVRPLRGAL